jgi:hypothetical protein
MDYESHNSHTPLDSIEVTIAIEIRKCDGPARAGRREGCGFNITRFRRIADQQVIAATARDHIIASQPRDRVITGAGGATWKAAAFRDGVIACGTKDVRHIE